ncbi:MAG TPA: DUF3021 domain-containing protein [Clostridiales bacterium]|jgi:hypothetical protein|nr:DUF3021 domain-containing protein [Clostridiales bacterium]
MKKQLITKALIGSVVGGIAVHLITLLINYFSTGQYLVCVPELTERFGFAGAIVFQTILAAVFGMVAFGGMCFFDIEKWSLLRASVVHCALILVTYIIVGLQLHWFSFDLIPILIMSSIAIFIYALIWLIMYASWKREIREMNRLAEEYKKDADTNEN